MFKSTVQKLTIATNKDFLALEFLFGQILNRLLGLEFDKRRRGDVAHTKSVCGIEHKTVRSVNGKSLIQETEKLWMPPTTGRKGFASSRISRRRPPVDQSCNFAQFFVECRSLTGRGEGAGLKGGGSKGEDDRAGELHGGWLVMPASI